RHVTGCHGGASGSCNGSDLRVEVGDRAAGAPPVRRDAGIGLGGVALERQDPTAEVLREHRSRSSLDGASALTWWPLHGPVEISACVMLVVYRPSPVGPLAIAPRCRQEPASSSRKVRWCRARSRAGPRWLAHWLARTQLQLNAPERMEPASDCVREVQ